MMSYEEESTECVSNYRSNCGSEPVLWFIYGDDKYENFLIKVTFV